MIYSDVLKVTYTAQRADFTLFSSFIPPCTQGGCLAGQNELWDCSHLKKTGKWGAPVQNRSMKPSRQKTKTPRSGTGRGRKTNKQESLWHSSTQSEIPILTIWVTILSWCSLPFSAVARQPRCNRESEDSALPYKARPVWQCSHDGTASQADPSTLLWETLNLCDQPPKKTFKTQLEEHIYVSVSVLSEE